LNFSGVDAYVNGKYPYNDFRIYATSFINDNERDEVLYSALYSLLLIAKYDDINRLITDILFVL